MSNESTDPMFDRFGVTFSPGDILFIEGEPGNDFYMIKSGKVVISKIIDDNEKTLDEMGPGKIFGEMAILDDAPRNASATALTEVEAYRFDRDNFQTLLKTRPEVGVNQLSTMAKRIFDAKRRIQVLRLSTDEDKIMDTLLMLAEREGANNSTKDITITNTPENIANWAAVSPSDARRCVTSLQSQGRIKIANDQIAILNYPELSRLMASKRKAFHIDE